MARLRMPIVLQANQYWRQPVEPVVTSRQLVEFVVLDVEVTGQPDGRYVLADVQVCLLEELRGTMPVHR